MSNLRRRKPLIWAHRGASGEEMENTVESFDLAIAQGCGGIESDVRMSRDGELFLFHDDRLRVDNSLVRPEFLTIKELKAINLSGEAETVRTIPTVVEVLSRYKDATESHGYPILFSFDVIPFDIAVALTESSEDMGMAERTVITPSDTSQRFYPIIEELRARHPAIPIVRTTGRSVPERVLRALPNRPTGFDWQNMHKLGIAGLNFRARNVSAELISRVQKKGYLAYVWDCHDPETMQRFVRYGADALYTNYPGTLRGVIDEL